MTQSHTSLPILNDKTLAGKLTGSDEPLTDDQIEQYLEAYEAAERDRLDLRNQRKQWVDEMIDPDFTKKEKPQHHALGQLASPTPQDFLAEGALRSVGYNVENIGYAQQRGAADRQGVRQPRSVQPHLLHGGQPVIRHLIMLRDEKGLSTEEIIKNYVFLTAGACGPCRFGMYVTEYRKALRDAGFDGFRVMLFQQQGGLDQATGEESGLEMNPEFFIAIIKAIVCGDVLNALTYRIRPYEVERGATNKALFEESKKILYKALYEKTNIFAALLPARGVSSPRSRWTSFARFPRPPSSASSGR